MRKILENTKIVVAGAAGLLGSYIVKGILESGGEVIAVDIEVEKIKSRLKNIDVNLSSLNLSFHSLDITKPDEVSSFFDGIDGATGAVNCTYPRTNTYGRKLFDVDLEGFNQNINAHLGSSFLFMKHSALYFQKNETSFSLVNISSVYGNIAPRFDIYNDTNMTMPVEYAAIKSAIQHLSKYFTKYLNNSNFRVNCVSPGGIYDNQPVSFLESYKRYTNGTGMLDVKDIVGTVIYLLSDNSRYVTGQNIIVDDGFSL